MTWLIEDRTRLDAFRQGDVKILAQTYKIYVSDVTNILVAGFRFQVLGDQLSFTGRLPPFDFDDVLQETFLKAFSEKARLDYDGLRPYKVYLVSIAKNIIIDHFRKGGKYKHCFISTEDMRETDISESFQVNLSPEQAVVNKQLKEVLHNFKSQSNEQDQQLFHLRFEKQLTRAQVAKQTGLSPMQIRVREERLRQALLKRLETTDYQIYCGLILISYVYLRISHAF